MISKGNKALYTLLGGGTDNLPMTEEQFEELVNAPPPEPVACKIDGTGCGCSLKGARQLKGDADGRKVYNPYPRRKFDKHMNPI